jgi:transcriptional regulator with XRE-family HTH domain
MDMEARARIARWLRWYRRTRWQDATDADMAAALELSPGTLSALLSGKRTPGLDVFIKLHRIAGFSADLMLAVDPPTNHTPTK